MKMTPYLVFDGSCREAFKFYEEVFGGASDLMTFGGAPAQTDVPEGWGDKIMHAYLKIGDAELMASDAPPQMFTAMKGMSVAVHIDDPSEAERVFAALEKGGNVTMPIQETFWAKRFGMVTDRFGTPWMINCSPSA